MTMDLVYLAQNADDLFVSVFGIFNSKEIAIKVAKELENECSDTGMKLYIRPIKTGKKIIHRMS